jgi:tubulin--tyrosine ligase
MAFCTRRSNKKQTVYAIVDYEDNYVQSLLEEALSGQLDGFELKKIASISELPDLSFPVLQYRAYEQIDFNHALYNPTTSFMNSYVIRKALIRKHYLSNTVANWLSKYPASVLRKHVKPSVDFELDYAEFLDEALIEAYELRESLEKNDTKPEQDKEWWILKPGMSDRGQGIRLFNSEAQLQGIFEEWDVEEDSEFEGDDCAEESTAAAKLNERNEQGIVTSQLRHFIAQPYIDPPLLLPSASGRKFHIRAYVLAVGSLKVFLFKEMLALFAEKSYQSPGEESDEVRDLTRHLTNTCLQDGGSSNEDGVRRFWLLDDHVPGLSDDWKNQVYEQLCSVTGEVFKAAAQGMLVHFQTLPNAFEVFGLDFLVDGAGTAWLLEVNAFPDFGQTGEELKEKVVGRLLEAVAKVAILPFFSDEKVPSAEDTDMMLVADLNLGVKI